MTGHVVCVFQIVIVVIHNHWNSHRQLQACTQRTTSSEMDPLET